MHGLRGLLSPTESPPVWTVSFTAVSFQALLQQTSRASLSLFFAGAFQHPSSQSPEQNNNQLRHEQTHSRHGNGSELLRRGGCNDRDGRGRSGCCA